MYVNVKITSRKKQLNNDSEKNCKQHNILSLCCTLHVDPITRDVVGRDAMFLILRCSFSSKRISLLLDVLSLVRVNEPQLASGCCSAQMYRSADLST